MKVCAVDWILWFEPWLEWVTFISTSPLRLQSNLTFRKSAIIYPQTAVMGILSEILLNPQALKSGDIIVDSFCRCKSTSCTLHLLFDGSWIFFFFGGYFFIARVGKWLGNATNTSKFSESYKCHGKLYVCRQSFYAWIAPNQTTKEDLWVQRENFQSWILWTCFFFFFFFT